MLCNSRISWLLLLAYILSSKKSISVAAVQFAHFPNSTAVFSFASTSPPLGAGSPASTGNIWLAGSSAIASHESSSPRLSPSARNFSTPCQAWTSAQASAAPNFNTTSTTLHASILSKLNRTTQSTVSTAPSMQPEISPSFTATSSSIPAPPTTAASLITATASSSVQTLPAGSGSSLPISIASSTLTTAASHRVGMVSTQVPRPYGNATNTTNTTNTITAAADRPASSGDGQSSKSSVVGVTIGVLGGLFAVILAALYFRRRRSRRPTIVSGVNSPRDSQRAYPECAWLYDPQMTPQAGSTRSLPLAPQESSNSTAQAVSSPAVPSRHTSGTYSLFPSVSEPRPGTVELPSNPPSPPPRSRYLVSPLFGYEYAGARDRTDSAVSGVSPRRNSYSPVSWDIRSASPGPSRSLRSACGSSMDLLQRPMSAIREEICRGPDEGIKVQRYIEVPDRSSQRHST
ncbi:hypothetical protein EJ03DRAFT_328858 [Teratosphaeria nubilosa]|uniref:Mid2 domain-containing protein n=1 Tax=Teratosphaeria nubilosa TaxID=161662 RepID=A0A6G1L4J2_9PEZI|nr:hypothetical protein EJ03DRAFT_328858 [Teratosphaeria nubilosa]